MAKEGSTVSGLMDAFATAISLALQHGVPLRVLVDKFAHTRFEPSGWTGNEQIGYAKSIMDYIFRWLQIRFLSGHQLTSSPAAALAARPSLPENADGIAEAERKGHAAFHGTRISPPVSYPTSARRARMAPAVALPSGQHELRPTPTNR